MKTCALLTVAATLFATSGVLAQANEPIPEQRLVNGNDQFAFELYARLAERDGNIFFSPYSISSALGMAYAGARGDTAAQMDKTLHFGAAPVELPEIFGRLIRQLRPQVRAGQKPAYKLQTANRLWGQGGFAFQPAFAQQLDRDFGAGFQEVDFKEAPEKARRTINSWIAKETEDKITDLIGPGAITPLTRLVLTNAIFLEASWVEAFREEATKQEDFKVSAKESKSVKMMHRPATPGRYYRDEQMHILEMPYKGGALSMFVFLPVKVDGLSELEKSLTGAKVNELTKKLKNFRVIVAMPRFKSKQTLSLVPLLKAMGMPNAFNDAADFTGIATEGQLRITDVLHQAFVDVNEKGTLATAATAVVIGLQSARPVELPLATFIADHPFVYMIRDNRTGSLLFLGRLVNPA